MGVTLDVESIQFIFSDYSQSMRFPCNYANEFAKHFLDLHTRRRESNNPAEFNEFANLGQGDARSSGVDVDEIASQVFQRSLFRVRTHTFRSLTRSWAESEEEQEFDSIA